MIHRRRSIWCRPLVLFCLTVSLNCVTHAQQLRAAGESTSGRTVRSLDADWRFHLGDAAGAEAAKFDDSDWRKLDVPHDWSIEGDFDQANPAGKAGAFLPGGVGWYRKEFTLPENSSGRRVVVEFDGVMANSEVWINGKRVGGRPSGYVSFECDFTDHVKFGEGETNLLAVRVDNSKQPASRWYTGAGIYRHVRLVLTDSLHVVDDGVFVTTPDVSDERATVCVQTEVANEADVPRAFVLETQIVDRTGAVVATVHSDEQLPEQSTKEFTQDLAIDSPRLWQLSDPQLYRAVTRIREAEQKVDELSTPFGIRTAEFKADTGFWLNGVNLKIKGVCLHHDGGAVGAAVPLAVWEQRLKSLQSLGVNAIRTAHNPPAPEFLDLCDRLGILVMDEMFDCWTKGKTRYDYHLYFDEWAATDTRDTVRRDRNHPCVILYSVGNEIRDTRDPELAKKILAELVDVCHRTDPTRPVTQGLFRPNVSHDYDNGLADLLDVIGTNYRDRELLAAWRAKPTRKIIGTEQAHDRSIWLECRDNPQHAGPVPVGRHRLSRRIGRLARDFVQRRAVGSHGPSATASLRATKLVERPPDGGHHAARARERPHARRSGLRTGRVAPPTGVVSGLDAEGFGATPRERRSLQQLRGSGARRSTGRRLA